MKTYKAHPYIEEMMKMFSSNKKVKAYEGGRRHGKKTVYEIILSGTLTKMKVGKTFGLSTIDGLYVFRLEEIRKHSIEKCKKTNV